VQPISGLWRWKSIPRRAVGAPLSLTATLVVLLGLLSLASSAYGAGELDPTFDGDGRVMTDFGSYEAASGIAVQADGKIVAAGSSEGDFALARYSADGSLDPSFDGDGRVKTDFGGGEAADGVAIQADGKIVAAGSNGGDFVLARYNPDGSLDPSFDGDGRVTTDFGAGDGGAEIAIQADGKIVAAGSSFAGGDASDFALARYNADGGLDPTFDGDGKVVTDFGSYDSADGVAIQADGRIVAVGGGFDYPDSNFEVARYNVDGSLDSSFDGDGRALTDFGGSDVASSVAIQADGRIVAAGWTIGPPNFFYDTTLARYNPDGSLDPSFDGDGRVISNNGADDVANAVAIQTDRRIVAAGFSGDNEEATVDWVLARFDPDGRLDPTFGQPQFPGRVWTFFPAIPPNIAYGVAIQSDRKIVAAGKAGSDFALARYLPGAPLNRPPDCSGVSADPSVLWPPSRRLRLVELAGASDPDGDSVSLEITGVTQDERVTGARDAFRASENAVRLRAKRDPRGDGRVYRVGFTVTDANAAECQGTATVSVPLHRKQPAVDSAPPSYDSFGR
jgi:uncharacterized delta-60 repeat protein